jgi:hypothetical protein
VNMKGQETAAVICNECVQLCVQVIALQQPEWLEQHRKICRYAWEMKLGERRLMIGFGYHEAAVN